MDLKRLDSKNLYTAFRGKKVFVYKTDGKRFHTGFITDETPSFIILKRSSDNCPVAISKTTIDDIKQEEDR